MLELKKGKKGIVFLMKNGEIISELVFRDSVTKKKVKVGEVK